eukprot:14723618-Ditylum_brightwellii.AAC.1
MEAFDQHLFNKSLKDWLNTTPQSKQHWLAAVHKVVNNFTEVNGRPPTQLTNKSFFTTCHTPSNDSTQSPQSTFCISLSQINYPNNGASETTSSWEEVASWADPAGDFDPEHA